MNFINPQVEFAQCPSCKFRGFIPPKSDRTTLVCKHCKHKGLVCDCANPDCPDKPRPKKQITS